MRLSRRSGHAGHGRPFSRRPKTPPRSRLTRLAAAAILATGGPLAIAAVPPAAAAAAQAGASIDIVNFEYQPGLLTATVGTTVTWKNTSDRPHTVTDRGGTFDTDPILPGQTATVTFTAPGTYHFFCRINPSKMNGIISVDGGNQGHTTVRVEAVDPALEGESLRFEPPVLTVAAGATVIFANVGGKPHTLTADDGSFDTGVVPPGAEGGRFAGTSATFSIAKPGRYNFHCEIHPAVMKGTITVEGETRAGPAPTPASNAPKTANVDMADFSFKDAQVSVAPGGEVVFKNTGQAPHTATFDDVQVDTGTVQPGATGKLTAPTKPGSYSYRCTIHPAKMRGVIVVVGQNTEDPAASPASAAAGAKRAVAVGGGGPGGGVSTLVLATGVIGGFFGGVGVAAFAKPKRPTGRERLKGSTATSE